MAKSFEKTWSQCDHCDKTYERDFMVQTKYCGTKCQRDARAMKEKAKLLLEIGTTAGTCGYCEDKFAPTRNGQKYCSEKCSGAMRVLRQERSRARRKIAGIPNGETKNNSDAFVKNLLKRIGRLPSAIDRAYG